MLRQVYVFKDREIIYNYNMGIALDEELFNKIMKNLFTDIEIKLKSFIPNEPKFYDIYEYRFTYIIDGSVMLLFVSDLTDSQNTIESELIRCKNDFMNMFEEILKPNSEINSSSFEIFAPIIENIFRNLKPKISLVGYSGVGKTTITKLIQAKEIPTQHIPTITGDIATIKIGKIYFHLWDFAGQEEFAYLWTNFIKGSDAIFIITDSTIENCEKCKFFIELIKEQAPHAYTAIIGNKQDLSGALTIEDIEKMFNLKTFSMVAVDIGNREDMLAMITDVLKISKDVSDLTRTLVKRDGLIKEAENAIKNKKFEKLMELFREISDLSIKLGEDEISKLYRIKIQEINRSLGVSLSIYDDSPDLSLDKKSMTGAQLKTLERQKIDLSLKITDIKKLKLELEIQNIAGRLSDEDYNSKIKKLDGLIKQMMNDLSILNQ